MRQLRSPARLLAVYGGIALAVLLVVAAEGLVGRGSPPATSTPSTPPARSATVAQPTTPAGEERNPLEPDLRTVFAGQQLHHFYCAACHATVGQGASDGELFRAISAGAASAPRHAYAGQLTPEQIWQLVAYLRVLEGQPAGAPLATIAAPTSVMPQDPEPQASVRDAPEPLPPLVFARRGNLWRAGGDAPLAQITQFGPDEYADQPVYSPAAGRVAFVTSASPDGGALYTAGLDGADLRLLWRAEAGSFHLPTWTADGAALLVTYRGPEAPGEAYAGWRPRIVRVSLADGARQTVLRDAHSPALSPDGRRLAFVRALPDGFSAELVVARPDGSEPHAVLDTAEFDGFFAPRFSPDGRRLLVSAIGGPKTGAGGLPIGALDAAPRARFDWLVPAAEAHGTPPWDVWIVDADGGGLRRLAGLQEDLPMAAFAPDGDEVIVMGYRGLYRMRADGRDLRRISLLGDHGALDWVR